MKSIFLNKFNFDSSRSEFRSIYVEVSSINSIYPLVSDSRTL